jgi:hypothetical protein
LEPSSFAASLSQSFSSPFLSFQLITVAPCRRISTLSPVGSTADTRELPCEMLTWGCGGRPGVVASAVGLFGRSTMVFVLFAYVLAVQTSLVSAVASTNGMRGVSLFDCFAYAFVTEVPLRRFGDMMNNASDPAVVEVGYV